MGYNANTAQVFDGGRFCCSESGCRATVDVLGTESDLADFGLLCLRAHSVDGPEHGVSSRRSDSSVSSAAILILVQTFGILETMAER